jgi:bifunctional non-homologous end joining protein LigD
VKDFAHRLAQAVAQSEPERFTAALRKAQRKGRIFVDYLRNQRGATAVMPYSARARPTAPVAAPVSWKEMETIASPARYHVGDAADLVKRACSKPLAGWGRASQTLPDL